MYLTAFFFYDNDSVMVILLLKKVKGLVLLAWLSMKLSGVSHLRAKENDSNNCSSCIVFYFCTYAKDRLGKVDRQATVLPKLGDNYLSVGSLCLTVSMFFQC